MQMPQIKLSPLGPPLRAYLSIFRMKAAEGLQYRIAALAGASISLFWIAMEILVYSVFYLHGEHPSAGLLAGLSLRQVITYVWLAQFLFTMQPMNTDSEILSRIQSGDVALELCRPLKLYHHWFAKVAAGRLIPLLGRGSVLLAVGLLVPRSYGLGLPASLPGFLCFLLSTFSAFLLCSAYGTLVCSIRLSIRWGNGPVYMIMLAAGFLSGSYLPLQLWPEPLQPYLLFQPFAGYLDIPVRFYLGSLPPERILWALGLQIFWSFLFVLMGKAVMKRKINRLIIQGG